MKAGKGRHVSEEAPKRGFGPLAYFGLDSGPRAWKTVVFVLPYLAVMVALLGLMSWAVNFFIAIGVWGYVLAIVPAAIYLFFFLARMHKLSHTAADPDTDAS